MSKSKSKGSKAVNTSEVDVLTKVKDAAIVKPAQTVKAKSKELAKKVAVKEDKKVKLKKAKEPTPEPSESAEDSEEESEEESEESEESESSDDEGGANLPKQNARTNGVAKRDNKEDDSDEESEDSDDDDGDGAPANGVHVKSPIVAKVNGKASVEEDDDEEGEEEDDEDDDDDEDDEEDKDEESDESSANDDDDDRDDEEVTTKDKEPLKAAELSKKLTPLASEQDSADSSEDSEEDEDEDEADSDDSEDSEEDSEEEEDEDEVAPKPKAAVSTKRKAEEQVTPAVKKFKTSEVESTPQGGNLFVGNLSWNVDEEWLTREFEEFGELSGVRLITDRESGRSKGFGYVEFVNAADAAKAHKAKKGAEIDGRLCNVDFANNKPASAQKDRGQARAKAYGDSTSEPSDTLFVGNLSFDAGQETISEAFADFGTVLGVRLPTDRESGQPKGFGYVTFSSVEEATAALEGMQGQDIAGRNCRLDYSQPRPQNGDSAGRGGRGGGRGGFGGRGGGRGGFVDRGGRGGRGRGGFGDYGGRGGRGGSTNRGGFGDFSGRKTTF